MRSNPYNKYIDAAREVMTILIQKMVSETDLKVFRNMGAVYIFWQTELEQLQIENYKYDQRNV